jgi:hypothetical protein
MLESETRHKGVVSSPKKEADLHIIAIVKEDCSVVKESLSLILPCETQGLTSEMWRDQFTVVRMPRERPSVLRPCKTRRRLAGNTSPETRAPSNRW